MLRNYPVVAFIFLYPACNLQKKPMQPSEDNIT